MASFFETAILKLQQLGFFKFLLPFILTAAFIYGALRRSQLFGDPEKNIAINTTIAFAISLFVWAAPVILGIDIEKNLATFFMQGISISLVVIVGLMLSGLVFPPDLAKTLSDKIKSSYFWGGVIIAGLLLGVVLLITSGLAVVFFPGGGNFAFSSDIFITIAAILFLGITVVAIIVGVK